MTSPPHNLSARLDALVERLTSCSLPTPTTLALEAAAELLAAASTKGKRNTVLTELFWSGKKGKELDPEGRKKALQHLEEMGSIKQTKGGKYKLTTQGVDDFAAISKKKAELVEKGVRKHASMDDAKRAIRASLQATLATRAYEQMNSKMTPPIYDEVFYDGVAALDAAVVDTETLRILATLERGDVVKIGSAKWAVYRKLDDMTCWAYKWPSKKSKIYTIRPDENPEAPGEEVVVFEAGGSGQRLGSDVAKGKLTNSSVQRKGADLDASVQATGNRDSAVVVTIPIPDNYAKRFPDPVTANHGHDPHLSVLFIGAEDYPPGKMSGILSTLRAACRRVAPFRLYVDPNAGLKDFGPNEEKGEKALWLPARSEPRGEVERLYRVLRLALEGEGIEVGAHDSFVPHVTWAYVPNDQSEEDRRRIDASVSDRFKEGFYFDVRQIMLSMPDGSTKALALRPIPRSQKWG